VNNGVKLDYRKTFLLGLGYLGITLSWSVYNSYVPIFLAELLKDAAYRTTLVGFIMTLDNIAAITLQPYFGAKSDTTWTRLGRRMPYLLVGVPVAAIAFALIPYARFSLVSIVITVGIMNLAMTVFKAPTVALMPDITPSSMRSKANGIINFMGGLGALLAFFVFSSLYRMDPAFPFLVTAVLMALIVAALFLTIRESQAIESGQVESAGIDQAMIMESSRDESVGIVQAMIEVWTDADKSARNMLLAIFFWFVGWTGIEALFTLYGVEVWGMTPDQAAFSLGFFSLSFLVFAIPSGFLATAIGRKKTILVGVSGISLVIIALRFANPGITLQALLLIGGLFWALVNINSYPMVVDMTSSAQTGAYTGIYYFSSSLAAIVAPPLFGRFMDVLGNQALFPCAFASLVVAFVFMMNVDRGEVQARSPGTHAA
jgi:maltose/moltooligosaccharide transporter